MRVAEFQERIEAIYGAKDGERGTPGTFMWLAEEVGELSRALRRGDRRELEGEFADVFAWLVTLASMNDVDLAAVAERKYGMGCPRCGGVPCGCAEPAPRHASD